MTSLIKRLSGAVLFGGALMSVSPVLAAGMFGGGTALDPSYCKTNPVRQTVIYVDDTDVVTGQIDWVKTLLTKLQQTLMPGERTTIVELSPDQGQSKEIWSGCWPNVTAEQQDQIKSQSHFFSGNPLDSLKEQQGFFARDFGQGITKIFVSRARPATAVTIDPAQPPQKSIIRSLSSDAARYVSERGTIRAIVYSDMVENSDLGSVFKTANDKGAADVGDKLGTNLRRSIFYVFGAGSTLTDHGQSLDKIRDFWKSTFQSIGSNLAGFGSDLGITNAVPVKGGTFDVTLKEGEQELHGHTFLLMDRDGQLVDSWIGITRLRSTALAGTVRCASGLTQCEVQATTVSPLVTEGSLSETLSLKSTGSSALLDAGATLQGTLGVPGSTVNLPVTLRAMGDH